MIQLIAILMPFTPYPIDPGRLAALLSRYRHQPQPALGYGQVRDFCDSVAYFPELTQNKDLKDLQRPWVFKTIISHVPPGARLLEIGAGDPHVAHWLAAAGYHVTLVDPYDGSGNGPTDYAFYRAQFPQLAFRREAFSDELAGLAPESFDCIYSISVLEHIPHDQLERVLAGIRKYQTRAHPSIHAVDCILKGQRQERHRHMAAIIGRGLGQPTAHVEQILEEAAGDTETYFLSAESHNLWRGDRPYDTFPMRRVISLQFCAPPCD